MEFNNTIGAFFRKRRLFGLREKAQLDTRQAGSMFSLQPLARPELKIFKMLRECSIDSEELSPRSWVKLSRFLFHNLSLVETAINIYSNLSGSIEVEESTVNPTLKALADGFIENVPIFNEQQTHITEELGLNKVKHYLILDALVDGSSFIEDRFSITEEESSQQLAYKGVLLFSSENFDYMAYPYGISTNEKVLTYLDNQYPFLNEEGEFYNNPFFDVVSFEKDRRDPWGVPLIRGMKFTSELFMTMLITYQSQLLRFGNPLEWLIIQQKNLETLLSGGEASDIYQESILAFSKAIKMGLKDMMKGKAGFPIQTFPGDVDVKTGSFGKDFNNLVDHNTFWKMAALFVNGLNIPPAFMNIRISGSGLQSDEFKYQFTLLMARIRAMRRFLLPVLERRLKNFLVTTYPGTPGIEKLKLRFSDLDLLTALESADIGLKHAQTEKVVLENYELIRALDPKLAKSYVERYQGIFSNT